MSFRPNKLVVSVLSILFLGGTLFSSCTALVDVSDDTVAVFLPGLSVEVTDDKVTVGVRGGCWGGCVPCGC